LKKGLDEESTSEHTCNEEFWRFLDNEIEIDNTLMLYELTLKYNFGSINVKELSEEDFEQILTEQASISFVFDDSFLNEENLLQYKELNFERNGYLEIEIEERMKSLMDEMQFLLLLL